MTASPSSRRSSGGTYLERKEKRSESEDGGEWEGENKLARYDTLKNRGGVRRRGCNIL